MAWGTCTFNQGGGSGGESRTLYFNYTAYSTYYWSINYWATAQSSSSSYRITQCEIPSRPDYVFLGYYDRDGYLMANSSGYLLNTSVTTSSLVLTARWTNNRKITLDRGNGTGGTGVLYYKIDGGGLFFDEQLTLPADSIDLPTYGQHPFEGFFSNESRAIKYINKDGTFTSAFTSLAPTGDITIYAGWERIFDDSDYFGLGSEDGPLMLVKSNSGDERSVVETAGTSGSGTNVKSGYLAIQATDSAVGGFARGGILRSPVCTYRIRKAGTVRIQLGKAYGQATVSVTGTASNPYKIDMSGYMLVQAEYATAADGEPVLVVRGAANEGFTRNSSGVPSAALTDAINIWTVDLAVDPDHIAQDPLGAVSGGGEMTECKTLLTCDPVVPMEAGMPCASDVVHGKAVVTATTCAYFGESAPTAAGSFVETNGVPTSESDVDFTSYAFAAERSL